MTVGDLVEDDVKLEIEGKSVRVTGTAKNITEPWEEFGKSDNTGHFLPLQMPAVCKGKPITVKGRKDGDRTVKITDDLLMVLRLENFTGKTFEIDMDGGELMTVNVTGLTLKEA